MTDAGPRWEVRRKGGKLNHLLGKVDRRSLWKQLFALRYHASNATHVSAVSAVPPGSDYRHGRAVWNSSGGTIQARLLP